MRTEIPYHNFEALENDIKNIIGEELYNECEQLRNKPSTNGFHFTKFIKIENGKVTYHFTRTAHELLYDYIFNNRDSDLWNACVLGQGQGYKMTFLVQ